MSSASDDDDDDASSSGEIRRIQDILDENTENMPENIYLSVSNALMRLYRSNGQGGGSDGGGDGGGDGGSAGESDDDEDFYTRAIHLLILAILFLGVVGLFFLQLMIGNMRAEMIGNMRAENMRRDIEMLRRVQKIVDVSRKMKAHETNPAKLRLLGRIIDGLRKLFSL